MFVKQKIILSVFLALFHDDFCTASGWNLATSSRSYTVVKGMRCQSRVMPEENENSIATAISLQDKTSNETTYQYCPDGYFCDLSEHLDKGDDNFATGLCMPCLGSSDTCTFSIAYENFLANAMRDECEHQCGIERNSCSRSNPCPENLFCDIEDGQEVGYCKACPFHLFYCGDATNSEYGIEDCQSKCDLQCAPQGSISLIDHGSGTKEPTIFQFEDVNIMIGSPQLMGSGRVVDCGLALETCKDADGAVCLIERGKAPFFNKTENCYLGGGVAAVIYNTEASCGNIDGTLKAAKTYIPSVSLSHFDGKAVLEKLRERPLDQPLHATVQVDGGTNERCWLTCTKDRECQRSDLECNYDNVEFGDCKEAEHRQNCNDAAAFQMDYIPCTTEGEFCDYSGGKKGYCTPCPEADMGCFFSNLNGMGAKECTDVCTSGKQQTLESEPCKFCASGRLDIGKIHDGFLSTEPREVSKPCEFCASTTTSTCTSSDRWDMKYPFRTIRIYGNDVECWAVAELYRSLSVEADSASCESARFFNYICGCSDSAGYAGADTETKQAALVWMPRVGAILSIIGSTCLIIGVVRDEAKRKKIIGEIIIFLCTFDIIGSIGYAFTSLPTPKEDYIYGAKGNQGTCTAQGFFIQIGTVALYANVSLVFYYLMMIKYSWREQSLRASWLYRAFFLVPLTIGFIFAVAGIPFYDNVVSWCNNSRNYWSEIPVIIGIGIATVVMLQLIWFVYNSERASKRFRRHSVATRSSLSRSFFAQAMVYLSSFYLTWVPYLALQLMIARGSGFSSYGFYLYASTAVTLQGFWNWVFHNGIKTRTVINKAAGWTRTTFFTKRSQVKSSKEDIALDATASS